MMIWIIIIELFNQSRLKIPKIQSNQVNSNYDSVECSNFGRDPD